MAGQRLGAATGLMDDAWWGPSIPLPGGPYFCLAERNLPGCVMVNGAGQRFVNESAPYVDAVHAMYAGNAADNPHIPAWLVFDQRYRDRYVFAGLPPGRPLPRRWYAAGAVFRAPDLGKLAAAIGVDPDGWPRRSPGSTSSPRPARTTSSAAASRRMTATTATRASGPTRTWRR